MQSAMTKLLDKELKEAEQKKDADNKKADKEKPPEKVVYKQSHIVAIASAFDDVVSSFQEYVK